MAFKKKEVRKEAEKKEIDVNDSKGENVISKSIHVKIEE